MYRSNILSYEMFTPNISLYKISVNRGKRLSKRADVNVRHVLHATKCELSKRNTRGRNSVLNDNSVFPDSRISCLTSCF